jgi:hypothetical protein
MVLVVTYGGNVQILSLILFILDIVRLPLLKSPTRVTAPLLVPEIMIAPLIINVVTPLLPVKNSSVSLLCIEGVWLQVIVRIGVLMNLLPLLFLLSPRPMVLFFLTGVTDVLSL